MVRVSSPHYGDTYLAMIPNPGRNEIRRADWALDDFRIERKAARAEKKEQKAQRIRDQRTAKRNQRR